jgi:hypothetical protein
MPHQGPNASTNTLNVAGILANNPQGAGKHSAFVANRHAVTDTKPPEAIARQRQEAQVKLFVAD